MTNAELIQKIKAEIERQRKFIEGMFIEGDNNFYDGQDDAYNNVLTFISTLEEEPVSEDLEEAAGKSSTQYYIDAGYSPFPNVETAAHKSGFIAGAKWQKEQDMDEWIKDRDGCFWDGVNEGKKAMKEQMLKEAVEGRIHGVGFHNAIYIKEPEWTKILDGMNEGDKIRILCLKEDEK